MTVPLSPGFEFLDEGREYRIEKVLGAGSFGITYEAKDRNLSTTVAIKEFFPSHLGNRTPEGKLKLHNTPNAKAQFEWGLTRFKQEAQILALFEHPNIVRVRRFFEANGTGYIVMNFAEGFNLEQVITEHAPLSESQTLAIIQPVLEGLAQIHNLRYGYLLEDGTKTDGVLLHRDIKPANIILTRNGPILIDFGAARYTNSNARQMTQIVSDGYAPKEQYYSDASKQGPYTDIYAVGAVLYHMVTGRMPLAAIEREQSSGDPMPKASYLASGGYSSALLNAIDQCLHSEPEKRPQSAQALLNILPLPSTPTNVDFTNSAGFQRGAIKKLQPLPREKTGLPVWAPLTLALGLGISLLLGLQFFSTQTVEENPTPLQEQIQEAEFLKAASRGESDKVKEFLQKKSPEEKIAFSTEALIEVAKHGHGELAEWLLSQGARFVKLGPEGLPPLVLASRGGHNKVAESLIQAGAKASQKIGSQTAFDFAKTLLMRGYLAQQELQELGIKINLPELGIRASRGDLRTMRLLDAALIKDKDYSALKSALKAKKAESIKTLMSFNFYDFRSLQHAYLSQEEANQALAMSELSFTVKRFHDAIKSKDFYTAQIFLNAGMKVDEKNSEEFTPLMIAVEKGYADMVQFLLNRGANIDEKTTGGETALSLARKLKSESIIEILNRNNGKR